MRTITSRPAVLGGDDGADLPPVFEFQSRVLANAQALPARYRGLADPPPYPAPRSEGMLDHREWAAQPRGSTTVRRLNNVAGIRSADPRMHARPP
jgi:hypothetical protein